MLYRTPNPLSFPFTLSHPLPPSSTVAAAPLPFHVQRVECLEAALKKGEMEDFSVNNGQNDAAGEDFFVDDLLVDGEDGFFGEETGYEHGPEAEDNKPRPVALSPVVETEQKAEQKTEEGKGSGFSAIDDFDSVPAADLADLEWLSHFVEDSLSGYSLRCPVARLPEKPTGNRSESDKKTAVEAKPPGGTPVQTKARSKRTRTGGRVWSLRGSPSLTESSSSTSSSSTTSDTWLIFGNPSQTAESLLGQTSRPSVKKQRKRKVITGGGGSGQPRRCSHCGVQKTPQWRTGPNGAKTLCNACGVRFKSGRLFPEYRPACSPTFSSEMHSNSHRKVLEMRRKKEAMVAVGPSPVQSF